MIPRNGAGWITTIRGRLIAVLSGCVLLPFVMNHLALQFITRDSLEENEIKRYSALTDEVTRQVSSLMEHIERNLNMLTSVSAISDPRFTEEERRKELARIAGDGRFYTEISLYRDDGNLIVTYPEGREGRRNESNLQWFRNAAKQNLTQMAPPQLMLGREGTLDVAIYVPVRNPFTGRREVIKGQVSFDAVINAVCNVDLGEGGRMYLINEKSVLLAAGTRNLLGTRYTGIGASVAEGGPTSGIVRDSTGAEHYWLSRELTAEETRAKERWHVVTTVPMAQVLAVADESGKIQRALGIITLCLSGGLGLWFARRLATPLTAAADAAHRLALGDTQVRIDNKTGPHEMRLLASAFNQMVSEVSQHRNQMERLVAVRTQSLQDSQRHAESLSAQFRAAFESIQEAIVMIRNDGTVLAANRQVGRFFRLPADRLPGTPWGQWQEAFFSAFADRAAFTAVWTGQKQPDESLQFELTGPERHVVTAYTSPVTSMSGESIGTIWVFRDLTRQRELQENLEQAQKMEAIGRLAGGVAHDFNNLLTGIMGNLSLAEMQMTSGSPALEIIEESRHHVHHAHEAAERAAYLVKGLLGFSRRSHLALSHCRLNDVIKSFLPLIRRVIDPRINIHLDLDPNLWAVKADSGKIEQVLMNLCVNARDAITGTGTIVIRTGTASLSATDSRRHQGHEGDHVFLSVTDSGCGMTPEIMQKIFEPFFTTKEQGKGTGLGLATSYGIIQQHGGWLECESSPGRGSTFRMFLPRDEEPAPEEAEVVAKPIQRGTETIMLVDDEPVVRMVAETLLKQHGYKTVCASDGQEAIDLYRENRDAVRLILMDMTMPRMSGDEAFRQLRALDEHVPVLICSGYVVDLGEFATEDGHKPNGFVQKPYNLTDLLATVRAVLDAEDAPSRNGRLPATDPRLPALAG